MPIVHRGKTLTVSIGVRGKHFVVLTRLCRIRGTYKATNDRWTVDNKKNYQYDTQSGRYCGLLVT